MSDQPTTPPTRSDAAAALVTAAHDLSLALHRLGLSAPIAIRLRRDEDFALASIMRDALGSNLVSDPGYADKPLMLHGINIEAAP